MYKLYDFYCDSCDLEWEDLVEGVVSNCSKCNNEVPKLRICSGQLASFSLRDPDSQRQELLRRSADHTQRELKRNPEQFGPEGVRRARQGQIRSFGGIKKK